MSLSIDGFWKSGFWTQTFWANGFWFEGSSVAEEERYAGGYEDYSRHPYLRNRREKEKFIEKQKVLEELISKVEKKVVSDKDHKKVFLLEKKISSLREDLDGIKILNALLAEQEYIAEQKIIIEQRSEMEEEESIFMLMCAMEL